MDGLAPTSGTPEKKESVPAPVVTTITIGDKTYDLQDAFPITLADWEKLDQIGVMDRKGMVSLVAPTMVIDTLTYFLQKLDPAITRQAVGGVQLRKLPSMARVLELLVDREEAAYKKNPTQGGSST